MSRTFGMKKLVNTKLSSFNDYLAAILDFKMSDVKIVE